MKIENILLELIDEKYNELKNKQDRGIFEKILLFEANAVGQIGEKFVKEVFKFLNIPFEDFDKDVIHDEFDMISNSKKIEIKTARKGINRDTFQFNGINPKYNYDYIILIAISTKSLHYYIINKSKDYIYNHKLKKDFMIINNKEKQLVSMNPGNQVNLKLTLNLKELKDISNFTNDLKEIFA
ncbi:restriction endonuclease [uncultured Campylobacter sp.]|uniref:restriction endonuclease n=1 Tax=uncultured Campylobacter sp. TaxID=218934 RepID=UPI00262062F7|nr:restriction endonuclease [uncultured Campylobacter sp.]